MRLVALDLETTGLNPGLDQILQVGMQCFESETGEVVGECEFLVRSSCGRYTGDPFALAMNVELFKKLAVANDDFHYLSELPYAISSHFARWRVDRPHAVGFNVGSFDIQFLKQNDVDLFRHRSIELGSLLMSHLGSGVPITSKNWARELGQEDMPHTALADCNMARLAYMACRGGV